jgi:hypothetical protein
MNRDDIIKMAREAGFNWPEIHTTTVEERLERFAALVRADERERIIAQNAPVIEKINEHIKALEEAVAAEREQCAKVCEGGHFLHDEAADARFGKACAAAIRARSNQ